MQKEKKKKYIHKSNLNTLKKLPKLRKTFQFFYKMNAITQSIASFTRFDFYESNLIIPNYSFKSHH